MTYTPTQSMSSGELACDHILSVVAAVAGKLTPLSKFTRE